MHTLQAMIFPSSFYLSFHKPDNEIDHRKVSILIHAIYICVVWLIA